MRSFIRGRILDGYRFGLVGRRRRRLIVIVVVLRLLAFSRHLKRTHQSVLSRNTTSECSDSNRRAISLVRSKAKEWNIDPKRIGMVGFSAGGHLVGSTCTRFEERTYEAIDDIDKISCRPDFGIMCYSGYFKVNDGLSPTVKTPKDTPPLFFVHATDDTISDVEHSITFYLALKRAKIDAEMQIFASGGHGFGVRPGSPCFGWTRTCQDWLKTRGILK